MSIIEGLIEFANGVWTRSPYMGEVLTNNAVKVGTSLLFEKELIALTENGNPTTESSVRDVLMAPGILINVYNKQLIRDGFIYDEFSVVGTSARGGGKVLFISFSEEIHNIRYDACSLANYNGFFNSTLEDLNILGSRDKVAFAARAGNVVLEPISMLLNIIIPMDRQYSKMTHITWYKYTLFYAKKEWFILAGLGMIGRAIVPDQLGEFYKWGKKLNISKSTTNLIYNTKNKAIESIFNINDIDLADNTIEQIIKAREQIFNSEINTNFAEAKADSASVIMFSTDFSLRLIESIFQAYLIMTPTREAFNFIQNDIAKGFYFYSAMKVGGIAVVTIGAISFIVKPYIEPVVRNALDKVEHVMSTDLMNAYEFLFPYVVEFKNITYNSYIYKEVTHDIEFYLSYMQSAAEPIADAYVYSKHGIYEGSKMIYNFAIPNIVSGYESGKMLYNSFIPYMYSIFNGSMLLYDLVKSNIIFKAKEYIGVYEFSMPNVFNPFEILDELSYDFHLPNITIFSDENKNIVMSYVNPCLSSIGDKSEILYDFSLPYILKASYLYAGYVGGKFMVYNLVLPMAPYVVIASSLYIGGKLAYNIGQQYKVDEKIKSLYDMAFFKEVSQEIGASTCDNEFCLEEIGKVGITEAEL